MDAKLCFLIRFELKVSKWVLRIDGSPNRYCVDLKFSELVESKSRVLESMSFRNDGSWGLCFESMLPRIDVAEMDSTL